MNIRDSLYIMWLRFSDRHAFAVETYKLTFTAMIIAASMIVASWGMILLGIFLLPTGYKVFTWGFLGLGFFGSIYVAVLLARRFGYNPEA